MPININKWLLQRLVGVWFVLSLISGALVQYLGHARLDEHIVQMAKTETSAYTVELLKYLESPSEQALTHLDQKINIIIKKNNFIVVKLYNSDLKVISEVTKSPAKETGDKLSEHNNQFPKDGSSISKKFTLEGETYLHVHFPVKDNRGILAGYFDGIYHAPEEIIGQMQHQTFWSLLLIVLAIFVTSLALYPLIIRLNNKLRNHAHTLTLTNVGMLKVLGSAIAKRDSDTNMHNYRVTLYSVRLGEALGIPNTAMQGLIKGAFLHDVGKIAISDTILLKPGKLTAKEFEVMETHVNHGLDIIHGYTWLEDAVDVVRYHHEKFDGSGYPCQVTGDNIPKNARIFAIIDVFDAITSMRPYKQPFSFMDSIKIIQDLQGGHFDPVIARVFLENAKKFYEEICTENEISLRANLEACISNYFDS